MQVWRSRQIGAPSAILKVFTRIADKYLSGHTHTLLWTPNIPLLSWTPQGSLVLLVVDEGVTEELGILKGSEVVSGTCCTWGTALALQGSKVTLLLLELESIPRRSLAPEKEEASCFFSDF